MNKKVGLIVAGAVFLLLMATGIVVYKAVFSVSPAAPPSSEEYAVSDLPPADSAIQVDLKKSTVKDNTVVLSVAGLGGTYKTLMYELSYETQNVVQGVTSQPLDISGKDTFVRDDIYLGTCSKNVCRPHTGVSKISVVIEFTDTGGKKSQFSKDYTL